MTKIKLTTNDIKGMVNEVLEILLSESVSSRVFHFLPLSSMAYIAKNNEILLSLSNSNSDTGIWKDGVNPSKGMSFNGRTISPYYLSLSRTPSSAVGYVKMRRERTGEEWKTALVRIELDGELLNANFQGNPVNYFRDKNDNRIINNSPLHVITKDNSNFVSQTPQRFGVQKDDDIKIRGRRPKGGYIDYRVLDRNQMSEYEDRILSDKPVINNAGRYIKRIDILLRARPSQTIKKYLGVILNTYGDRTFIYDNEVSFNSMNIRNAMTSNPRFLPINMNDFYAKYGKLPTDLGDNELTNREIDIIGECLAMPAYICQTLNINSFKQAINNYIVSLGFEKYGGAILERAMAEIKSYTPDRISLLSNKISMNLNNHLKGGLKYTRIKIIQIFDETARKYIKTTGDEKMVIDKNSIYRIMRKMWMINNRH